MAEQNFIHTGNDYADQLFYERFMEDPILNALLDYLTQKGILDDWGKFEALVNKHCTMLVLAMEKTARDLR